ncbi:MAG: hypothetical protein LDL33_02725 [Desulfomonile sp.]|nr:hypothetical protein [Desulfomonile sp.]
MKRLALLIIATLVAATIPVPAFAQGYPGYNPYGTLPQRLQPRGPDMLTVGPPAGPMGPPMGPGPCGPPPCMPMMPSCKEEKVLGPTAAYLGYLTNGDAVDFRFTYHDQPLTFDLRQLYRLDGLWLGLSQTFLPGEHMQFLVKGSWFFPLGENTAGHRSDEFFTFFGGHRNWDTAPQWWNVDVSGAYMLLPSAAVIGGFRFDSFQTVFKDPSNANFATTATDRADINLVAYIPYIGVLATHGTSTGATTASIIGFPAVPGYVTYHESLSAGGGLGISARGPFDAGVSYFLEASLEHAHRIGANGSIAAFAKWNVLRAKGRPKYEVNAVGGGLIGEEPYDFLLNRQAFILGARVQFDFGAR